jgi:hypothetical protein
MVNSPSHPYSEMTGMVNTMQSKRAKRCPNSTNLPLALRLSQRYYSLTLQILVPHITLLSLKVEPAQVQLCVHPDNFIDLVGKISTERLNILDLRKPLLTEKHKYAPSFLNTPLLVR